FSPLRKTIAYTIATLRRRKSQGYYRQIGGGSPLRRLTEEQAQALGRELERRGKPVEIFVGMCTWHPFLREAMDKIELTNLDRLVILPLFPQYSVTTTGSGFSALRHLIERRPLFRKLPIEWISSWADHPAYIECFAQSIQRELAGFGNKEKVH